MENKINLTMDWIVGIEKLIRSLNENTILKFKELNEEEKKRRGILGRLYGPVASFKFPTRNNRKYPQELWEKLFDSPLIKERFRNGGIFGQLCHPNYSEVDMEKIAVVMPEPPVKDNEGNLQAYLDIVDTPCGKIAYQLAKYGYKFGISTRGEGDLITDFDGNESVDPDTYTLSAFDLVEIPAVASARLTFTESLNTTTKKTLKESLDETLSKATEDERKLMREALTDLHMDSNFMPNTQAKETKEIEGIKKNHCYAVYDEKNPQEKYYCNSPLEAMQFMNNHPELSSVCMYTSADSKLPNTHAILLRIVDIKDLTNIQDSPGWYPVYIDGEPEQLWWNTGEITNIEEALKQNKVVIQYVEPKNKKGHLPIFKDRPQKNKKSKDVAKETDNKSTEDIVIEELQKTIKSNNILQKKVLELQEKLATSYNRELTYKETLNEKNETIKKMVQGIKSANVYKSQYDEISKKLQESIQTNSQLKEQLVKYKNSNQDIGNKLKSSADITRKIKEQNTNLKENLANIDNKYTELNKTIKQLNESIREEKQKSKKLKEQLEQKFESQLNDYKVDYEKKINNLNESVSKLNTEIDTKTLLIEKYKHATDEAINKYIESKADMLGTSVFEIKKRLPESFSFKDIEEVCSQVQIYTLNRSKLPYGNGGVEQNLQESLKIKEVKANINTTAKTQKDAIIDDDIDNTLMYLSQH